MIPAGLLPVDLLMLPPRPSDLRRSIEILDLHEHAMPDVLMIDAEPIRHIEMQSLPRETRIPGRGVGLLGMGRTPSLAATIAMALAMDGGTRGLPLESVIPGFGSVALPPDVDAGPSEDDLARIAAAQAKRDLKAAKTIENQKRSEADKQAKA